MTTPWIILLVFLLSPFIVYLSVKLGTVAYYRGKKLSETMEKENGEK
jgi:hypothetical protein